MSVDVLETNETFGQKRSILAAIRSWLDVLAAARECGAAVNMGQRPSDQALRTLGIDPARFAQIRLL